MRPLQLAWVPAQCDSHSVSIMVTCHLPLTSCHLCPYGMAAHTMQYLRLGFSCLTQLRPAPVLSFSIFFCFYFFSYIFSSCISSSISSLPLSIFSCPFLSSSLMFLLLHPFSSSSSFISSSSASSAYSFIYFPPTALPVPSPPLPVF